MTANPGQIAERIWAIGCANNLDLGKSAVAAREDAERCHLVPGPAPATGRPAHRGCEGVAGVNPPRDRDSSGAGVFIPAREIEKFGGSGIRRACGPGKPGGATRTPRLPACCENPAGADLRRGSHQGRSTVGSVARSQVATGRRRSRGATADCGRCARHGEGDFPSFLGGFP